MPGAPPPVLSASISLIDVVNWDGKSQEIHKALTAAFDAEDYLECIKNLKARQIEPLSYINNLDKAIDSLPAESDLRRRYIRALRKTCGVYGILPASYEITSTFGKPGQRAFASGGFADVWRITDEKDRDQVFAVKSIRVYEQDPVETINKKYCKEVIVCKRAKHPNILSIEGVAPKMFEFCMVSRWMPNGNMHGYITKYPGANRLELLAGVARGLNYLHQNEVIHGDLKGQNILIDMKGSPRLSDFGLCSITRNIDSVNASTPNRGCTIRYCAPELLDPGDVVRVEKKNVTTKTDVYSLSMVIVELATGEIPYIKIPDPTVILMVSKGKRPHKPHPFKAPGMSPAIWKIARKCWNEKARDRPEVDTVLQYLADVANIGGCTHEACSCLSWELIDSGAEVGDERAPSPGFRQRLRDVFSD